MIPRFAIEQANKTYQNSMKRAWDDYMGRLAVIFKTYQSGHSNADKSLASTTLVATRTRDASLREALGTFKQMTSKAETSSWETYEQAKQTAEENHSTVMDNANQAFGDAERIANENYQVSKGEALKEYEEVVGKAMTSYKESLP